MLQDDCQVLSDTSRRDEVQCCLLSQKLAYLTVTMKGLTLDSAPPVSYLKEKLAAILQQIKNHIPCLSYLGVDFWRKILRVDFWGKGLMGHVSKYGI